MLLLNLNVKILFPTSNPSVSRCALEVSTQNGFSACTVYLLIILYLEEASLSSRHYGENAHSALSNYICFSQQQYESCSKVGAMFNAIFGTLGPIKIIVYAT